MEHLHLCVNLSGENNSNDLKPIRDTGISLKLNKALLISSKQSSFFNSEEYFKYVIEIKIKKDQWIIFRRFSEIRDLHDRMCKIYPALNKEAFPNRSFFNKTDSFQLERQQKLEQYLMNMILIGLDDVFDNFTATPAKTAVLTKQSFIQKFDFFIETSEDILNVKKLGWGWKSTQ